jgi:hypothetical protein
VPAFGGIYFFVQPVTMLQASVLLLPKVHD